MEIPSKGKRRYRKTQIWRVSKSDGRQLLGGSDVWERMRGMLVWLKEKGWTFSFQVEARSPSGFKSAAVGDLPTTAFMKAMGSGV